MTSFDRLIRRVFREYQSWKTRRKIYQALPEMRSFDMAEEEASRRHSRVNEIRKARQAFMTQALRGNANGST
ncbi:hypothetical protein [Rhizobium sp. NZLR11]|uniref:hypothetical protein n=1 Tax=Rhizobium sp. NZLR11 TaxID=2731098 RepID=UPI001C83FADC|nr:hypothetical protein [Rhizobium sp. NZLR11]MBX5206734.1 hypothetical protein [Rhizobium sp. NZLR11]